MKPTLKIHGLWAVAALFSFGVGWKISAPATSANDDEAAAALKSQRASRSDGDETAGSTSRREKRATDASQNSALGRLFGLADGGSESLLNQALRDPNPIMRRLAFSKLLESMTPENASSMREQMIAIGAAPDQMRDFHYAWGALDGKAAFESASNSPERDLAATMTGWAAANPTAALALLDNLPTALQGQREELIASVVEGLADNNRALATDYVLQLARDGNGQAANLIGLVTNETLRAEGPEAASRWTESLPAGPMKSAAMGRVANAYVRTNPEAAARWVSGFANEEYAASAIEQTGRGWAQNNPVAAVGWLETLPSSSGQAAGLRSAFSDWEDSDPAAAGEYLTKMPLSAQRDSSISGFATGYAWQNPQLAIQWAQEIRDPALRESSLTQAGRAYHRRDPNGWLTWVENSGLSESARQQMQQSDRRR
ncbi:MAG: hypothetical protein ACRCXD_01200 [Luteolibacter sp.]